MGWVIGVIGIGVAWLCGLYAVRSREGKIYDLTRRSKEEIILTDRIENLLAKGTEGLDLHLNEQEKMELDNLKDERLVARWKIEFSEHKKA